MNVRDFQAKAVDYGRAHRMLPWMIGDLLNEFVESHGEEAWQYVDGVGISRDILRDYMYVAGLFDEENRYDYALSVWYFREVCSLKGAQAHYFLQEAILHGWSSKDLRAQVKLYREDPLRFSDMGTPPALSGGQVRQREEEADAKEPQVVERESSG